jgi:hypothetical protein
MGLCASLAAFGLFVGAVWSYVKQQRQMQSRLPATGTVVDLAARQGNRGIIYCPVVEFSVPSGEKGRFTSEFGSRPATHQVGQSVNVRYNPVDPQKAEIESAMSIWLTPLILVFMGAIACCLGIVFLAMFAFVNPSFSP